MVLDRFSRVLEIAVTEEKKAELKVPAVRIVPADPVVVLSQAPPMSLSGPKPLVDKPTTVVASTFNTMK
jgi:hypothetical protein